MHPYTSQIQNNLAAHANPLEALPMKRYMRDQFEFLGIKTPQRSALMNEFILAHGLPAESELENVISDLWSLTEREYQYTALGLIEKMEKKLPVDFLYILEKLIITKSWWDTVDTIAGGPIGTLLLRFPQARIEFLPRWQNAGNIWLRRTAILFQLGYKDKTDFNLLRAIIEENLGSKEFFINKAIGWALRQYSRVDGPGVREFVAATPLSPLSAREALSWLEKHTSKNS